MAIIITPIPQAVTFDAVAPTTMAFGDVAAVGAAAVAPRRDHLHGAPPTPIDAWDFAAYAYRTTAFTLTTAVQTAVPFPLERFDTDGIHDLVVNNSRLTCQTAGIYMMGGASRFTSNTTGVRALSIRLNGAALWQREWDTNQNDSVFAGVSGMYQLAVADYIELFAYQTSGGNLDLITGGSEISFWMARVAT